MTVALVIGLLATPASRATGASTPLVPQDRQARESTASPPRVALVHCSARRAVRFYAGRIDYWNAKLGAPKRAAALMRTRGKCPRYLSHVLQRKAYGLRKAYGRWFKYQYAWWTWMPDKWQRIGACETGYGRRPGNFRHSNSSYEGFAGFAKSSWDSFKYRADPKAGPYPEDAWQATPRQQYEVALAIYRAFGLSGWGCRNA